MSRLRKVGLGILLAVFALGLPSAIEAKDEVPYKDRVLGVFTVDGNVISFNTVGQATQLGRFTSSGELVFDTESTFTGTNTLTAANGDTIELDITSGSLTPTDDPDVFIIELETEFTSGTGRFQTVSGGFSGVGELNTAEQFFVGVGEGTISPPGKNKKK